MEANTIYQDLARRTGGEIYIGVVGPVRTGKSTFIKRFMEALVLPAIKNTAVRQRATDELPQSAAGRTVMTTEPKFVPEQAITLELENGVSFRTRLIDCVGYLVQGAMGTVEDERPRMVKSPWYDHAVPFEVAAETGTRKVITEHSTIGLVLTTDGSISDLPRSAYEGAEARVISEMKGTGKPFAVLLNCVSPDARQSKELATELTAKYGVAVIPISCVEMTEADIRNVLKTVLYEFAVQEIGFTMPKWITMLEPDHWLQESVYCAVRNFADSVVRIRDLRDNAPTLASEYISSAAVTAINLDTGTAKVEVHLAPDIFYKVLGEQAGLEICDEASLMPCVIQLARVKKEYEKIRDAMQQVEATGYGIVMPTIDELHLEEPEIVKQSGRYGVRLKASAPSIQMLKTNITTEISPIVGSEKQSEELVMSLLKDFEEDPIRIWESNIFGKSLHELVNEGLQGKLLHMPTEARLKLQETLERVINEGCQGLICIIL
ncbi:stage IV sporulation protein A [Pygmaiobacter massiliensis]|uniref:stage IV sporulation protein A n=1 Tax=Pygmaiobacter massiliensis TaxID=1917873 RepID=UPI002A83B8B4|nr:stage IV sporulation protein A [Pygmaiobacter massiliensis]MDY4785586.1 stage IV sporulation protein A [Pygmaiobacter massiliensis]